MINLLIRHVIAITLDAQRRVINDAAIAIRDDRIVGIGPDTEITALYGNAAKKIDGRCMAAIPGLIDCHAHAGHGLLRSIGLGDADAWFKACSEIYARGSTVEFWRAEARLAQLERLKAGVTTCLTLLGGGRDVYRTDHPVFGDTHCQVTRESGLRTILAVGPGKSPFPKRFKQYDYGGLHEFNLSFRRQLEVSNKLIRRWGGMQNRRTGICLTMPVYRKEDFTSPGSREEIKTMSNEVAALRQNHDVLFTQDGHSNGSIAISHDLGLLGPFSLLSHCVDITPEDIQVLKNTGSHVIHNPSSITSVHGRCPAPELLGMGINVCIGSDAGAPDRGFDMFRHMSQCMHYHRRHFRDPDWMPPGKVLEMTTIDAAKALGLDKILGSLEVGKKADIVLVDLRKPHLYPMNMPVTRLAHFANAGDVDTVIVDGAVLLSQRIPMTVNEEDILDAATVELKRALGRTGLEYLIGEPSDFWGVNRYRNES